MNRPRYRQEHGFLLFEILIGMGILGITISAMLWSLTEGASSYSKLRTRLVAIKLLQERMESLDGRFNPKDLPIPIGSKVASVSDAYDTVPFEASKGETDCGKLTGGITAPYVAAATPGDRVVGLLTLTFPAPLSQFGCVERVYLMTPENPANQKTKLVLYKVRVEVYWPLDANDVTVNDQRMSFSGANGFLDDNTGMLLPNKRKEMLTASTILLRAIP